MRPCDFSRETMPVGGVAQCPELAAALAAGNFRDPDDGIDFTRWEHGPVEDIGRYRFPGRRRESYIYRLQALRAPGGDTWWHAYGEYCPLGRSATDADYIFLDGGGLFSNRAAALWAIHLWIAHLHRDDARTAAPAPLHGD
jgi:hypothetical protein